MDGIIKTINGKYKVSVRIQEGIEDCGEFESEEAARVAWKDGHKMWNGSKRKKKDAPMFEVRSNVVEELVRVK